MGPPSLTSLVTLVLWVALIDLGAVRFLRVGGAEGVRLLHWILREQI